VNKTIVACVEDLFFRSKIDATARHLNVPVRFSDCRGLPAACSDSGAVAVLLELSANGEALKMVRELRSNEATRELPIIGFLSHVDRQLARDADAAGVTRVLPRSEFSETLPEMVMDLLAPGTRREIPEEPELPDE
jgi:hypothetical protein